ncbi:MAG: DsrE family protein [Marinobacter sp.]|uniref:DsrE family protein n=1 Tax=Marinobacter sp. TaxID=50741 RepID=UPI003564463D
MKTLVIINQAPYGNWSGREALDMALSLAAFDQPATLLFTSDGVNWLRKDQQAAAISQKSVDRNLAAASIFGVSELLADHQSCHRFGLDDHTMIEGITLANINADFLRAYGHVISLS